MHTCFTLSEDVHVVLGLSSYYFFINFFHFFYLDFPGLISIGIDTLWAQLLLELSTDHFETMHICSTWSEELCLVLGLTSYRTDLKVTTLYWQSHVVGGRLPATGFYPIFYLRATLKTHLLSPDTNYIL